MSITLFLSPLASAGINPESTDIPVYYKYSGQDYETYRVFDSCKYIVTNTGPWCGHYTATSGYMYTHTDIPSSGFPFYDPITGYLVTVDNVKARFDATFPDYTYVSPATCQSNCHGYTTGKNQYISTVLGGVSTIKNDDYINAGLVGGGRYAFEEGNFGGCNHSYKVTGTQSCTSGDGCTTILRVSEETEKWNSSPVYKRTYSCGDAQGVRNDFDLMKPK